MKENAKNPGMELRVLYVSTAGRKVVSVVPEGNTVSIGRETWKVHRNSLFPGKGKFDVICVQGQSEAMSPWGASPLSPEEFDAVAHNNLLEQIHSISRGGKTGAANWIQIAGIGVVLLCVVGFGWSIKSDLGQLDTDLKASHADFFNPPRPQSTEGITVVHPNQTGGTGPP